MIDTLKKDNEFLKEELSLLKMQLTEDKKSSSASGKSLSSQLGEFNVVKS
jgi:hypothetical protein